MNGQHCFWLHWFLLRNEVRFLSIACNCNLFISLAMKMLFFHCNNKCIQRSVTRPQDRIQVDARKIYPKRSRLNLNFWMITVITEKALRNLLSRLLYEKSGGAMLKPSTWRDQSFTSSPLSSICLNAPFYCFEPVIRPRNSIIILYFFSSLALFLGFSHNRSG